MAATAATASSRRRRSTVAEPAPPAPPGRPEMSLPRGAGKLHQDDLNDEFEGWPPPTGLFFAPGGGPPSTVWFPLELQGRDYMHRCIDLASAALAAVYGRLVQQDEAPPCVGPKGEPLPPGGIQGLDLLRFLCTARAAAGLAEELRIPEHAIVGGIGTLVDALLLLGGKPGEVEEAKVLEVLAAARTLVSGAGVDESFASNLTRMALQHSQHERYSARRWAGHVDGEGGSALQAVPGGAAVSKGLRERRATIAAGVRIRKSTTSDEEVRSTLLAMRDGAEAEEALQEAADEDALGARVGRLSGLATKWCARIERLESVEECTKALRDAAEALTLVLHETRKANGEEEAAWRGHRFEHAAEIRKRLEGSLKEAERHAADHVKDAWARIFPNDEVDEGKKLLRVLDGLDAEASTTRDYEVSSNVEALRGKIQASLDILAEREAQGRDEEDFGKTMGQHQLYVLRAEEALAKEAALGPVKSGTRAGGEGEKELAEDLRKVRQALELLHKEHAHKEHAHGATSRDSSRPNSSKSASSKADSNSGSLPATSGSKLLKRLSEASVRLERRARAWGLLRRFESANEEQGLEMMREALERQVVSQGGGNDSRQISFKIEAGRGIRGTEVLKVLLDPLTIAEDVEKYAKELADGREEQVRRWHGHVHSEVSGAWLTRTVGSWGTEHGELRDPCGIAFGANGRFLVADRSNHRIQVLAPSGNSLSSFGEGEEEESGHSSRLQNPSGVAQGRDGQIIVTDRGNNRLLILGSMLQIKKAVGMQGNGPGKFQAPLGVAVGSDGSIFVADSGNNRVVELDPEGDFVRAFDDFRGPSDVACSEGLIAVADTGSHSVVLMQRDGKVLWRRGSGEGTFAGPAGVAFQPGGSRLVVSDSGNNRLQILRVSDGELADTVGSKGGGAGQLQNPRTIDVSGDGVIAVADCGNHRVCLFERRI